MIYDVGRYCYKFPVKFYRDSEQTQTIRTYFTAPGARGFPFPIAFGSRSFDSTPLDADPTGSQVGLLKSDVKKVANEPPDFQIDTDEPCGSPEQWLLGSITGIHPPLLWTILGYSSCCLEGAAPGDIVYNYDASGGLNCQGAHAAQSRYNYAASGGLSTSGSSPLDLRLLIIASGGLKVQNAVTITNRYTYLAGGRLAPSNSADKFIRYNYAGSGRLGTSNSSDNEAYAPEIVTEIYTTSGTDQTWLAPSALLSILSVECWGGGGGPSVMGVNSAFGGGGGAYARETTGIPSVPGGSYLYTVGSTVGIGGNAQASEFSYAGTTYVKAVGGNGGSRAGGGAGGNGASCIGTTKFSGGNGGSATPTTGGGGGGAAGSGSDGGNASGSTQGAGGTGTNPGGKGGNGGIAANGMSGFAPGGGAGGGAIGFTSGTGADGQVIITYSKKNYIKTTLTYSAGGGLILFGLTKADPFY